MGIFRKALFVGTGGLSGVAGIKANSKKERSTKALEWQNKQLAREQGVAEPSDKLAKAGVFVATGGLSGVVGRKAKGRMLAPDASPASIPPVAIADELAKLAALHGQGALTDEEFNTAKSRLLESN